MERVFVPLVTVDIQPRKNAERPAIELTTRTCQCPTYEVPLIRAKWGKLHAETITERPQLEHVNPLYELLPRDGLDVYDTEEKRLKNKYGSAFTAVYRDGELRAKVEACAESANEYLDKAKALEAQRMAEGAEKAAAALVKESGKAIAEAYAKAEKRGPGRPRKQPTPEPVPTGA